VTRLLAALKERNGEVERLQRELETLRVAAPVGGSAIGADAGRSAGALAREAVIEELEGDLTALREANAALQGDLHARSLTIGGLRRDLQGWKDRWHDLARQLDDAATAGAAEPARVAELTAAHARLTEELATVRRTVTELTEERDALAARNANLFETTGFANRQMEVLADDLAELRGQLKALRNTHATTLGELETVRLERANLQLALADSEAEAVSLERLLMSLQAASMALGADLVAADRATTERLETLAAERLALADDLAASVQRAEREAALAEAEQASEAERMRPGRDRLPGSGSGLREAESGRSSAEAARERVEAGMRETVAELERLHRQAEQFDARRQQLERQLEDRSALVLALEQDLIGRDQRLEVLASERMDLEADLARATRNVREQTDFIQQLDDRLERQKELLLSLEQELSAAQAGEATLARQHEVDLATRDGEIRALQLQVAALQAMLNEQTTELESARPIAAAAAESTDTASRGAQVADPDRVERDNRTLRVLNQQLRDARARNDALLERIRELETQAQDGADGESGDDLTCIRGVGPRLAQHLQSLGVKSYRQIAELEPELLDDPSHALAALRSRILRDRWIEQADTLNRH
jgi:predicted flap endonuclease-1-like 5' DNA nuclease